MTRDVERDFQRPSSVRSCNRGRGAVKFNDPIGSTVQERPFEGLFVVFRSQGRGTSRGRGKTPAFIAGRGKTEGAHGQEIPTSGCEIPYNLAIQRVAGRPCWFEPQSKHHREVLRVSSGSMIPLVLRPQALVKADGKPLAAVEHTYPDSAHHGQCHITGQSL